MQARSGDVGIEGVRDALPILKAERDAAQVDVEECDAQVEIAAEAVVASEAAAMAEEHLDRLEELRIQYYVLCNLFTRYVRRTQHEGETVHSVSGHLYGSGGVRQIIVPPIVAKAVSENILGTFEQRRGFSCA